MKSSTYSNRNTTVLRKVVQKTRKSVRKMGFWGMGCVEPTLICRFRFCRTNVLKTSVYNTPNDGTLTEVTAMQRVRFFLSVSLMSQVDCVRLKQA